MGARRMVVPQVELSWRMDAREAPKSVALELEGWPVEREPSRHGTQSSSGVLASFAQACERVVIVIKSALLLRAMLAFFRIPLIGKVPLLIDAGGTRAWGALRHGFYADTPSVRGIIGDVGRAARPLFCDLAACKFGGPKRRCQAPSHCQSTCARSVGDTSVAVQCFCWSMVAVCVATCAWVRLLPCVLIGMAVFGNPAHALGRQLAPSQLLFGFVEDQVCWRRGGTRRRGR